MIKHCVWVSTSRKGLTFWEMAFLADTTLSQQWSVWLNIKNDNCGKTAGLQGCTNVKKERTRLANLKKILCVSSFSCQGLIPNADMSSILWLNTVPVRALLSALNCHFHTDIHCSSSHWKKTVTHQCIVSGSGWSSALEPQQDHTLADHF